MTNPVITHAVDPNALQALLVRVEACDDAFDRALDAEIQVAIDGGEIVWKQQNYTMEQYAAIRRPSKMHVGGFAIEPSYPVTSSVDAACGMLARLGLTWSKSFEGWVCVHSDETRATHRPKGATLPLKLVAGALMHRIDALATPSAPRDERVRPEIAP